MLLELGEEKLCLREASERYQKCLADNPPPRVSIDSESIEIVDLGELVNPFAGRVACASGFLYDQLACSGLPF